MSLLGRGALGLARSRLGGVVAWVVLSPLRALSPFRPIAGDGAVTVLGHPRPSYPVHYLVVPRRRFKDFLDADLDVVQSAIELATALARRHPDDALELWTNLERNGAARVVLRLPLVDGGTGPYEVLIRE